MYNFEGYSFVCKKKKEIVVKFSSCCCIQAQKNKYLSSPTSTIQSRFPSLSTNTPASLGGLSSGINQTTIPAGSQPLIIKPFLVSAAVLKLDHSTSTDQLLTILQFFCWGPLDAALFSHPWVVIPSQCHGYDGFSSSAFMLGLTGE